MKSGGSEASNRNGFVSARIDDGPESSLVEIGHSPPNGKFGSEADPDLAVAPGGAATHVNPTQRRAR